MLEDQLNALYLALDFADDQNVKAGLLAQIEELEEMMDNEWALAA